jgi:hypothetical protein
MKHLKLLEEYARDRIRKREREAFDNRSVASKKREYDANSILKKIKNKFPKEEFIIDDYYDKAKCVFLHTDHTSLLNSWNRDSNNYNDGLNKDFAEWLTNNKLKWTWRTAKGRNWWDGIQITPTDFQGLYWYYGDIDEPPKKIISEDKSFIDKIIKIFNNYGYNVYEPEDVIENDRDGSDRNIVELNEGGMIFRFEIMKETFANSKSAEKQIKDKINKYIQIIIRYYSLIKTIYDYCETIAEGPLWTMCGGGMQLQQFYGDDNGYICIQYLAMEDVEEDKYIGSLTVQGSRSKKMKIKKTEIIENSKNIEIPEDIQKRIYDYNLKKNLKKYNL